MLCNLKLINFPHDQLFAIYKTLQYIKIKINTEKYNYDLFSREILVC